MGAATRVEVAAWVSRVAAVVPAVVSATMPTIGTPSVGDRVEVVAAAAVVAGIDPTTGPAWAIPIGTRSTRSNQRVCDDDDDEV